MAIGNIRNASQGYRPSHVSKSGSASSTRFNIPDIGAQFAQSFGAFSKGLGDVAQGVIDTGKALQSAGAFAKRTRQHYGGIEVDDSLAAAQNESSDSYLSAMNAEGSAAKGVADKWMEQTSKNLADRAAKFAPDLRKDFERRSSAWLQGKYQNLKAHEARQVRAGAISDAEFASQQDAANNSLDLVAQAKELSLIYDSEKKDADEALAKGDIDQQSYDHRMEFASLERSNAMLNQILQTGAVTDMGEDRFQNLVNAGYIDQPRADAMRRKHRRTVLSSTISSLAASNNPDAAQSFLDAIKSDDAAFAREVGFDADDLAKFDSAIEASRKRIDSERRHAEYLAQQEARDNAARVLLDFHSKNTLPADPEGRADLRDREAALYDALAQDQSQPATSRESFAASARRLREDAVSERDRSKRLAAAQDADAMKETAAAERATITLGKFDPGTRRSTPFSAREIQDRAMRLYADRKISYSDYSGLMKLAETRSDKSNADFLSAVCDTVDGIVPGALSYDSEENAVRARPVVRNGKTKAAPASASPVKTDSGEQWLYSQLADAASLTIEWKNRYNKSNDEAVEHFNSLASGIVDGYNRQTIDSTLAAERDFLNGQTDKIPPPRSISIPNYLMLP